MYVHALFLNDSLVNLYRSGCGPDAVAALNTIKKSVGGEFVRIKNTSEKMYEQRWVQKNGPIARLQVERIEVL